MGTANLACRRYRRLNAQYLALAGPTTTLMERVQLDGDGSRRMCNNFINGLCKNGVECSLSHSLQSSMALFNCTVCTKIFSSKWGLTCHAKTCGKDPSEREKFPCHLCRSTFGTKSDRTKHIKRHGGKRFKCEFRDCHAAFKSVTEKKTHEKRIHFDNDSSSSYSASRIPKEQFREPLSTKKSVSSHDVDAVAALAFLSSSRPHSFE